MVAGLILVVLVLIGLVAVPNVKWVGSTDLQVEFAVTNAITGEPIPGATVDIRSEGGFHEEREPSEFRLVADSDGRAMHVCPKSMCFGTRGLITDTFVVHLPFWWFRVSAPGYEPTALTYIDEPEDRRVAKRDGPGRAKLIVPVSLRRN